MADELTGTAGDEIQDDPQGTPEPVVSASESQQSFTDPAALPPELKEIYGRMHRSYQKQLEKFKGAGSKAEMVDKFWSDPDFARNTIQQWAQHHGVALSFGNGQPAQSPSGSSGAAAPPELIEATRQELPDELKWMAPALAKVSWRANRDMLAPLLQQQQTERRTQRQATYEEMAEQLSEKAPGWEAHEDDMNDLLDFLTGPEMVSRRWGPKLDVLHAVVTQFAGATRDAVRRMGDAARARTSMGGPGRVTAPNLEEQIANAKTNRDAWKLAGQHAVQKVKEMGIAVREG